MGGYGQVLRLDVLLLTRRLLNGAMNALKAPTLDGWYESRGGEQEIEELEWSG